jgi:hypothetical protein
LITRQRFWPLYSKTNVHSFSALASPRRSLVLGPGPFAAHARPAFAHLRRSPLLGIRSFWALARSQRSLVRHSRIPSARQSSAFAHSRPGPFAALPHPAFLHPWRSPVLGVYSFASLVRSQRSLVRHSPNSGARQYAAVQSFPAPSALARPAFAHPGVLPFPAPARSRRSSVLGVRSFSALAHSQRSLVRHSRITGARQSSACTRCRQSSVLSVRSFSAHARSQRSLVPHSLTPDDRQSSECTPSRCSPIPSAHSSGRRSRRRPAVPGASSFSANVRHRRSLVLGPRPFAALARPVFAHPRRSAVFGVHWFSAILRLRRSHCYRDTRLR